MSANASHGIPQGQADSVRFIPEQVAAFDQFQHRNVAKVIARAIVRHSHLRTIGLLGRWGSGKSTTVGFVPEEIERIGNDPCLLFTYDAWLYQSDAPRPAFIDALFEFLVKEGRLDRKDWNDHVAMLTGHLQVTYASERPFASLTSRLMLVAALGSPLGVLVMARHKLITAQWSDWTEGRLAMVAAGLVLLPIAVWMVAQVLRILAWGARYVLRMIAPAAAIWIKDFAPSADSFWGKRLARWRAQKILILDQRFSPTPTNESWSWILSRKPQATEQRKVGKATPSSADFQRAFRSMVEAALKAGDDRPRLVIAVDNLDRLPVPEAVALWSVIRGFFLGSSAKGDALERLTILLPMDEAYVAQIQGQVADIGTPPVGSDQQLARGLMEKTFDLTLRLPRPAFTNWQGYFAEQLAWALYRTAGDDDVRNIGTVLNDAWNRRVDQITPRMVNAMVNRIIATWLRWEDDGIELLVVAFYAINQDVIDAELLGALKRPNILVGNAPDAWQSWLAAMHFGIEPKAAIQLLLGSSIVEAIDDFDANEFRSLSSYNAFPELLRSIVEGYDSSTPDATVLQVADLCHQMPIAGRIAQRSLQGLLCRAFRESLRSETIGEAHVQGLKALIDADIKGVEPETLVNQFVDRLGSDSAWGTDDAEALTALMVELPPFVHDHGLPVYLIVRPKRFFDIAETAWEHPEWLPLLRTSNDEQVLEDLIAMLDDSERASQPLRYVHGSGLVGSWARLIELLGDGFAGRRKISLRVVSLGLGLLRLSEPSARQVIRDQSTGTLQSHIERAYQSGDTLLIGRFLALALLEDNSRIPTRPWTTEISADGEVPLVEEVHRHLKEFGTLEERSVQRLDRLAQSIPSLAGLVARLAVKRASEDGGEHVDALVGQLGFYLQQAPATDLKALITAMRGSPSFWSAIDAVPDMEVLALLGFMREKQLVPSDELDISTLKHLGQIPNGSWTAALMGGSVLFEAFLGLSATSVDLPELAIAMNTFIEVLPSEPLWIGRWAAFVRRLRSEVRNQLLAQFASALLKPDFSSIAGTAVIHLPELSDTDPFQSHPDVAVRQVLPGLLSSTAAAEDISIAGRALISVVMRTTTEARAQIAADIDRSSRIASMANAALALGVLWHSALEGSDDPA